MFADPGHSGGKPRNGVVSIDLGTVARPAVRYQPQPGQSLLGSLQQVGTLSANSGGESADFRDRLSGAVEKFTSVLDGVPGTVGAAGLLICEESEDEVAFWQSYA